MRSRVLLCCDRDGLNDGHRCLWLERHFDSPARIKFCYNRLAKCGLLDRCELLEGRRATAEELQLCHPADYLQTLSATRSMGQWELEALSAKYERVFLSSGSYKAALWAAGSAVNAMESLLTRSHGAETCHYNALVLARPAGHEAFADQASTYCLLNNVAICAEVAVRRHRLTRVLVIDWSASPGHGTRILLQNDRRIVVVSVCKHISGAASPWLSTDQFTSTHGNVVSIPLNTDRVGDSEYLAIFQHIVCPIAREFDPELVLISAGFDGSMGDPMGELNLTPGVYAHLIKLIQTAVPSSPVCAVLEGGYHAECVAEGVKYTLKALLGDPPPTLGSVGHINPSVMRSIWQVCAQSQNTWKSLKEQMNLFQLARDTVHLKPFYHSGGDAKPAHGEEFRKRIDALIERGLYPTRSDHSWPEDVARDYDARLEEIVKTYGQRKPRHQVAFLYPAKSLLAQHVHHNYSTSANTVLLMEQNRSVSDKELHFVQEQTKVTINHEHDFGGSQLMVDQENEVCRLMVPLVNALDSMRMDQTETTVCVVDLRPLAIIPVLKSAIPLLRKMRKVAAYDRVMIVDVSYYNRGIPVVREDGILVIYISAFADSEQKSAAVVSCVVTNFAVPIAYEYDPHLVVILGNAQRCSTIIPSFNQFANGRSVTLLSNDSDEDGVLACIASSVRSERFPFKEIADEESIQMLSSIWATDLRFNWLSLADRLFDLDTELNAEVVEAAAIAVYKERSAQLLDYAEGKRSALPCTEHDTRLLDQTRARMIHKFLFCVSSKNAQQPSN
uniref:Histone deacetylase domain-containing protein n=1 Tax=Plectus sambesii TaxID=2011161 RepID=A0A914XJB1_9BILA